MPPVGNGVSGESGSVVGNADDKGATVFREVVNPIGNGDANGIGAEVMIENTAWMAFPALARIFRSQASASSRPPPSARPCTAASVGTRSASIAR